MGDFNVVLENGDRVNDNLVTSYETLDFGGLLDKSNFREYKSCGDFFSWSNKGLGEARIASRIDRCLVNSCWLTAFLVFWWNT